MKKMISFFLIFLLCFQIISFPVHAFHKLNSTPAKPKMACLPLCAIPLLPALPAVIKGLVDLAIVSGMITITISKADDIEKELLKKQKGNRPEKIIYRMGSGTAMNLTPRGYIENGKPKDWNGLSYSSIPPAFGDFTAISCEAVNLTVELQCYSDPKDKNHYLIKAKNPIKHQEWMNSRDQSEKKPHLYTKILMTLSVKVKK